MNYRHAFHAGNFADLVKHAALLQALARLQGGRGPLAVIDTHAGRGLYRLDGAESRRSGEAEVGVRRLMAAVEPPLAMASLAAAVRAANGEGAVTRYPGSPWLIAQALRAGDSYLACELRPEEHGALAALLRNRPGVRTACADGYAVAAAQVPPKGAALVLIDPPFERGDDYARILDTLVAVRRRNPLASALVWLPLKDLETFDRFLRDLEDVADGPVLVAEARMRPLADPLKMNGCALALLGLEDMADPLRAVCGWTADVLGQAGQAKVYRV